MLVERFPPPILFFKKENGPRPVQEKNFLPNRGSFTSRCSDSTPFAACRVSLRLPPRSPLALSAGRGGTVVHFSTACRQGSAQRSGQRGKRRRQARPAAKAAPAVREESQLPLPAHAGAGVSQAAFWVLFRRGKSTSPRRAKPLLALKACNAPFISPGRGGRSRPPLFLNPPAGPDDPGPGRPRPAPSPA